jgi:mediator of RNA polymerase II transcription subunit 23
MLQTVFTKESEEINKVFILCIARSFIVTGLLERVNLEIKRIFPSSFSGSESMPVPWCTEFLSNILQITPHAWSASTLEAMPTFMSEWYRAHTINDAYRDIRARVDEDFKKLTSKFFHFPNLVFLLFINSYRFSVISK